MSPITFPWRRRRAASWRETEAAALAVADVTAIHIKHSTVRAVVTETLRVYGGPEGVRAELDRRLATGGRQAARTLDWARRIVGELHPMEVAR